MNRGVAARRLGALVVGLGSLAGVFAAGGVIGPDSIRESIAPLGAWGPLLFIPAGAILGTLLVPGAAISAAAGLLFGPWLGLACALASAVLGALLSRRISASAGGEAFEALASERLRVIAELARRRGLLAVIVARLLPLLPDGPTNHAFGVAGLRGRHLALGTLIASPPRALSYGLLGANADDLTGTAALVGVALNVGTGAVGLLLGAWLVQRGRRDAARARRGRATTDAA